MKVQQGGPSFQRCSLPAAVQVQDGRWQQFAALTFQPDLAGDDGQCSVKVNSTKHTSQSN